MKNLKRAFALFLTFVMCLSLLPTSAFAAEVAEESCDHSLEYAAGVDADCVTDGCVEHYICTICGECFADEAGLEPADPADLVIPAYGHVPEAVPAVAATAEEPGLTEGSRCSVCGETLVAQTPVEYAPTETEPLYLDFIDYKELDEHGAARYEVDAAADTELELCPLTDSNGALTYKWQRYDAGAEDESLRWVNIEIEENADAESEKLTLTPTAELLNVPDLLRCVVTAEADGQEPLTGYALFTLTYEEPTPVLVTGIALSAEEDRTDVAVGETLQLSAAVTPEGADAAVEWTSSDEAIATVDENGLVTGAAMGSVTVTAAAKDGSGVYGEIALEVVSAGSASVEPMNDTAGDWVYEIVGNTVTVTGYTGADSDVTIPSAFDEMTVTAIGANVFARNLDLVRVTAGEGLTDIGMSAFSECANLTEVNLPASIAAVDISAFTSCTALDAINVAAGGLHYVSLDGVLFSSDMHTLCLYPLGRAGAYTVPAGVTAIGEYAFNGAAYLTGAVLPAGVTDIGRYAFGNCSMLTGVNIPSGVVTIGEAAFAGSSLRSVSIPATVETMGGNAFYRTDLSSISVAAANPNFASLDGVLFNKDLTELICCPQRMDGVYTVPDSVTAICGYAFSYSNLSGLVIPGSVISIDNNALTDSGISKIYGTAGSAADSFAQGHGLTFSTDAPGEDEAANFSFTISADGSYATVTSYNNASPVVNIPDTLGGKPVKAIGSNAFAYSDMTQVAIPETVTRIGSEAFLNCQYLASVAIPPRVTAIGDRAFADCAALEAIDIPASVTSIGGCVFSGDTALRMINVSEDSQYFRSQDGTLFSKDMTQLLRCLPTKTGTYTVPESVRTIKADAFSGCTGLTNISLWGDLSSIEDGAFSGCTGLTNLNIPGGVTYIGDNVFSGCENLESLHLPHSLISFNDYSFQSCGKLNSISVDPGANYSSYNGALLSGDRKTLLFCPAAYDYNNFDVPESVTAIGDGAFSGCTDLTIITLPEGLSSIGDDAFRDCTGLSTLEFPESLGSIGNRAFSGCTGLSAVTLPGVLESVSGYAFAGCTNLVRVSFPRGLKEIGGCAFSGTGLTAAVLPEGLTTLGENAFDSCRSLTSVRIPNTVTEIGAHCFTASGLTIVSIPAGVETIGEEAFSDCDQLVEAVIQPGVKAIGRAAFFGCGNLQKVTIPGSVSAIGDDAFRSCGTPANELVIICPSGSAAMNYAVDNGISYDTAYSVTQDDINELFNIGITAVDVSRNATLSRDLNISIGQTLSISNGAVLAVPSGISLIISGELNVVYGSIDIQPGGKLINYGRIYLGNGDVTEPDRAKPISLRVGGSYSGNGSLEAVISDPCTVAGIGRDKIDAVFIYPHPQFIPADVDPAGYRSATLLFPDPVTVGSYAYIPAGFNSIIFMDSLDLDGAALILPDCWVRFGGNVTLQNGAALDAQGCQILVAGIRNTQPAELLINPECQVYAQQLDLGEGDEYGNPGDGILTVRPGGILDLRRDGRPNKEILIHTSNSSLNWPDEGVSSVNCRSFTSAETLIAGLQEAGSHPDQEYDFTVATDMVLGVAALTVPKNVGLRVSGGDLELGSNLRNEGIIFVNAGKTLMVPAGCTLYNGGTIILGAQYTDPQAGYLKMDGSYEVIDLDGDGDTYDVSIALDTLDSAVTGANAASALSGGSGASKGRLSYWVFTQAELQRAITLAGGNPCSITTGDYIELSSSLTIPENVDIQLANDLYVPAGKTLTVNGRIYVNGAFVLVDGNLTINQDNDESTPDHLLCVKYGSTVVVNGVLTNNCRIDLGSFDGLAHSDGFLYVNGSYKGTGLVSLNTVGSESNLELGELLSPYQMTVTDESELISAAVDCANGSGNIKQIFVAGDITLTQQISIPKNVALCIGSPDGSAATLTLGADGIMTMEGGMGFIRDSALVINGGALINSGSIYLYYDWDNDCSPSLTVTSGNLNNVFNGYIYVDSGCTLAVSGTYSSSEDSTLDVCYDSTVTGIPKSEQNFLYGYGAPEGYYCFIDSQALQEYTSQGYKRVVMDMTSDWVLNGDSGAAVVIPENLSVKAVSGYTLTVPAGQTLEVNGMLTTIDGGVIDVKAGGTLSNNGFVALCLSDMPAGRMIMNGTYTRGENGIFIGNAYLSGTKAASVKTGGAAKSDALLARLKSEGTVTLVDGDIYCLGKSLVIPAGKELIIGGGSLFLDTGVTLTVSAGATLTVTGGILELAKTAKVINSGTMNLMLTSPDKPELLVLGSLSGSGVCNIEAMPSDVWFVRDCLNMLGSMKTYSTFMGFDSFVSLRDALNAGLSGNVAMRIDAPITTVGASGPEDLSVPENVNLILNNNLTVVGGSVLYNDGKIKVSSQFGSGALTVEGGGNMAGEGIIVQDTEHPGTVSIPGYRVSIDGPSTVASGKSIKLTASFEPQNTTNTSIKWRLSDPNDAQYVTLTASGDKATVTAKTTVDSYHEVVLEAYTVDGAALVARITVFVSPITQRISIRRDQADVTNQTLTLDAGRPGKDVMSLYAQTEPAGTQGVVTWSSSAPAIATVSPEGLVTAIKPGIATIKATAIDGSGKYASVKVQVSYLDAAARLTAGADIPPKGLQSGYSTQMQIFGTDKTVPMDAGLFSYSIPAAQQAVATVDENTGVITAGDKPGSATVTATLNKDPLRRKVTLSVKVIAPQADSVLLTPVLPDSMPYELQMLDANGAVTVLKSRAVSYRLILDKSMLGTGSAGYTFTISPTADYVTADGSRRTESTALTYASSDAALASVAAARDGSATVTVKRTAAAYGECTITGTAKDLEKASNILTIQVRDYSPRLQDSKLTLNAKMDDGVSTALLASYGNDILSVGLYDYDAAGRDYDYSDTSRKFDILFNAGELKIFAGAGQDISNGSYKTMLKLRCANNMYYFLPLTVVVKNSIPAVTVKQSGKFELFYKSSRTTLTVSVPQGEYIRDVSLIDNALGNTFDIVDTTFESENRAVVTLAYSGDMALTAAYQAYNKVKIAVDLEHYNADVVKDFTIATTLTKPRYTLSAASSVINTTITPSASLDLIDSATKAPVPLDDPNGLTVTGTPAGFASVSPVIGEVGKISLELNEIDSNVGGKAVISVKNSDWAVPLSFNHTVTVTRVLPTAKLSAAALTVNTIYNTAARPVVARMNLNQAGLYFDGITCTPVASTQAIADQAAKLTVALEQDGKLTVYVTDPSITPGAYSYKLTPVLQGGTDLNTVTLRVTVNSTLPTAKLASARLTLNSVYNSPNPSVSTTLSLSRSELGLVPPAPEDIVPITASYNPDWLDVSVSVSGSTAAITATVLDNNVAPGTYGFRLTPRLEGGTELKPVTLYVNVVKKLPTVKLQSTGVTLNAMYPDARSTVGLASPVKDAYKNEYSVANMDCVGLESLEGKLVFYWDSVENAITAQVLDPSVTPGAYTCKLTPRLADGTALAPITFKVTIISNPTITAAVTASGKLDAVNRASASSAITYAVTKLTNISGTVQGVFLTGQDADKFIVMIGPDNARGQKTAILMLSPDAEYSTALTYKVQLSFTLEGAHPDTRVLTPVLNVRVAQSALKLSADKPVLTVFQSNPVEQSFRIDVTSPDSAMLRDVKVNSATALALNQALGDGPIGFVPDPNGGSVTLRIADASRLKAGASYSLVLDVTPSGMATNLKPTQLKLTVKVAK